MSLADLTTEGRNPASEALDRLSSLEIVRLMCSEDQRVSEAVGRIAEEIAKAVDVIADRLAAGGRLIYVGAGTSGRLGVLDAAECPPTFNSPPWQVVGLIAGGATALTRAVEGAEDHPELAVEDLRRIELSDQDVLVGIATSGRTPYVIGGLQYARQIGAYAIGFSCNADSELNRVSDLILAPVVGPEVVSGSTRLKAGTATKLVLNMLTTGAMVRLGKTYGNLMVDLQTTNQKLADRSGRIVAALTGLPRDQADELLEHSAGDVKTAFLVQQRGVSVTDARRLLQRAQGRLRDALEAGTAVETKASRANELTVVLGVDGGGSKTLVWLVDANGEDAPPRGVGQAGPSNPMVVGWHAALANIDRAIGRAFAAAEIARQPVSAVCLAVAGTAREAEQQRLESWVGNRHIAEQIVTTHDALPVLAAGTTGGFGIALISGTGSFAFGRNEQGTTARAGGWGQQLGDDGSGYAIARAGLQAVTRAHDGIGPATQLTETLLQTLEIATVMDLREVLSGDEFDARRLASLAPLVVTAAEAGDPPATAIVDEAARGLSALVLAVKRQLADRSRGLAGDPDDLADRPGDDECELALSGGLLVHSDLLRERLLEAVTVAGLKLTRIGLVDAPVRGAVQLARDAARPAGAAGSERTKIRDSG